MTRPAHVPVLAVLRANRPKVLDTFLRVLAILMSAAFLVAIARHQLTDGTDRELVGFAAGLAYSLAVVGVATFVKFWVWAFRQVVAE
ncbi:MAG TPA: hypothetical protein VF317_12905 [Dermatophilaceae bacterium]